VTWKWRHLTRSHLEVAVQGQKRAYTVHFTSYKAYSSQEEVVTWQEMTSCDFRWPEETRKWRHLTESHLEVKVESQNSHILYISLPTRRSLAEGGSQVTANDVTWPQMTGSDPEVTSFDRKLPGRDCRRPKTSYAVHFISYKAVARRRRQLRDTNWHHITSGDRKWPWSDVIWPEVTLKLL